MTEGPVFSSADEALAWLALDFRTVDQIQAVVENFELPDAPGHTTVLYSGGVGTDPISGRDIQSASVAAALDNQSQSVRRLNTTELAKFLDNELDTRIRAFSR